jgi:excisionase family DNA binding protein
MDQDREQPKRIPSLSFTPDEAAQNTGVSRTRIFQAIRDEELTARKAGKSTLIEMAELTRWLGTLPTKGRRPKTVAA